MTISTRVTVPESLAEARSLDEMWHNANQLRKFDTPAALPLLGVLDARAPGYMSILLRFAMSLVVAGIGLAIAAGLVMFTWRLVAVVFNTVLLPLYRPDRLVLAIWAVTAAAVGLWYLLTNARAKEALRFRITDHPVPVALPWRLALDGFWLLTWVLVIETLLLGLAGLLILVLAGMMQAWTWLGELGAAAPVIDIAATSNLPLPYVALGFAVVVVLLALLLAWKAPRLLLGALWLAGAYAIAGYLLPILDAPVGQALLASVAGPRLSDGLVPPTVAASITGLHLAALVAGLGLLLPLRIIYLGTRLDCWPYRRWCDAMLRLLRGWRLRRSLALGFAWHQQRNTAAVGSSGAAAVCQDHLRFFDRHRAGPVTFWWCPVCHDDAAAYKGVTLIRGVLDAGMHGPIVQEGPALQLNLRAWQNGTTPPESSPLQEVRVGRLDNPHELEVFITQYHGLFQQRGWPPLKTIRCVLASDCNLDENGRRQAQMNMRFDKR